MEQNKGALAIGATMPRFVVIYEQGDRHRHLTLVEMQPWAYNYKHPPTRLRQKSVLRILVRKRVKGPPSWAWGAIFTRLLNSLGEIPLSYDAVLASEGEAGAKAFVANLMREASNVET